MPDSPERVRKRRLKTCDKERMPRFPIVQEGLRKFHLDLSHELDFTCPLEGSVGSLQTMKEREAKKTETRVRTRIDERTDHNETCICVVPQLEGNLVSYTP